MPKLIIVIFTLQSVLSFAQSDYLTQPKPAQTPQIFAPGIVSTGAYERDLAISPDGKEIYWSVVGPKNLFSAIVFRRLTDGKWSETQVASFSGRYSDIEAAFSPDGKRLYFASNRPLEANGKAKDFDIWYVERTASGWSEAKNIGPPINTPDVDEYYPSLTHDGTIYYTAIYKTGLGKDDIWRSKRVDGKYTQPELVGRPVSTDGYEFNAFIVPDDSKLFYTHCIRKNGVLDCDLVVSHHNPDGTWSEAEPLEGVNSEKMDYCPFVSPDGKYLFFTSERAKKDWQFDKSLNYSDLLRNIQSPANGEADIYWVELKSVLSVKKK
jgi:Tol biopolymer transport system component